MKIAFGFFLRLFLAFVAGKFFLRIIGWESRLSLITVTALLTANLYWFDFIEYWDWLFLRRKLANPTKQEGKAQEKTTQIPPTDDPA